MFICYFLCYTLRNCEIFVFNCNQTAAKSVTLKRIFALLLEKIFRRYCIGLEKEMVLVHIDLMCRTVHITTVHRIISELCKELTCTDTEIHNMCLTKIWTLNYLVSVFSGYSTWCKLFLNSWLNQLWGESTLPANNCPASPRTYNFWGFCCAGFLSSTLPPFALRHR